jgi:simple sugar transport system ATP-binding protein
MDKYKIYVPLDATIDKLSLGDQQKVEILKALIRNARLLILDEPTTNLNLYEVKTLKNILLNLKSNGVTIIIISHKLRDVIDISDRIAILRRGELVKVYKKEEYIEEEIVKDMFGLDVSDLEKISYEYKNISTYNMIKEKIILEIYGITTEEEGGAVRLRDLSLKVLEGEILGIAGVAGNGQKEFAEVIVGVKKVKSGKILFEGRDITFTDSASRYRMGIFYIPENRLDDALLPSMSIADNIALGKHHLFKSKWIYPSELIYEHSRRLIEQLGIKARDPTEIAGKLSGGNIQKILIARSILIMAPRILIAHNPTRGLDLATARKIHRLFLDLKSAGTSIILISDDLDEITSLSDRISVIYKGHLSPPLSPLEYNYEKLAKMIVGIS